MLRTLSVISLLPLLLLATPASALTAPVLPKTLETAPILTDVPS